MQGLGGAQLWHENNFLLCEASVNLGITKCKVFQVNMLQKLLLFVWITRIVNHAMSWSKRFIPGWICHGEQSTCHVVY